MAFPHTAGLRVDREKPFQNAALHPQRRGACFAGDYIKRASRAHDKENMEKIFVRVQENFFLGRGYSHKQYISATFANLASNSGFLLPGIIPVPISGVNSPNIRPRKSQEFIADPIPYFGLKRKVPVYVLTIAFRSLLLRAGI